MVERGPLWQPSNLHNTETLKKKLRVVVCFFDLSSPAFHTDYSVT